MSCLTNRLAVIAFCLFATACGGTVHPDDAGDGGSDVISADRTSDVRNDIAADALTCGSQTCATGQACCAATGACYDPTCLSCCMEHADVPVVMDATDATVDVPPDAPRVCTSAAECRIGEICVFANSGCSVQGTCAQDFGCGRPSLPYCGCDGVTFFDHCAGPASRWVSMGACPDAGFDSGVMDVPAVDVTPGVDVRNDSGGGACSPGGGCATALNCCGVTCVNFQNDPTNCGSCGHHCTGATPMCSGGTCVASECSPPCGTGSTCCEVNGPGPARPPMCIVGTTCPVGCPLCV